VENPCRPRNSALQLKIMKLANVRPEDMSDFIDLRKFENAPKVVQALEASFAKGSVCKLHFLSKCIKFHLKKKLGEVCLQHVMEVFGLFIKIGRIRSSVSFERTERRIHCK
jgi:hypothetical protein